MSEDDVEDEEDLEEPQLVRANAKIAHSATEKSFVFIFVKYLMVKLFSPAKIIIFLLIG